MLALPMSGALAKNDKLIYVSGEFAITYSGDSSNVQKGKSDTWIQTYEWDAYWSGGITGSGTAKGFWVLIKHDPSTFAPERIIPQEVATLSNPTINGEDYAGDLVIGQSPGSWRILSGTDDLANVHGQGKKWIVDIFTIGYDS